METSKEAAQRAIKDLPQDAPVPLIWMLGKTGSGKSSIIRFITGADEAEIGNGFRPQTKNSREFSFPDDQTSLVRFLDTRGLGEAHYDPDEDLKAFGESTNLVIITVRATDQATHPIMAPLKQIRRQNPDRPVVLVITALHDACPGGTALNPNSLDDLANLDASDCDDDLTRCVSAHLTQFRGLYDTAVAIDLTRPEDGFFPCDFGGDRLFEAIMKHMPAAMQQTLATMEKLKTDLHDSGTRRVDTLILTHATLAAGAAAVPVAWVDMPVVLGLQTHLAHRIAKQHGQTLTPASLTRLSAILGGRAAIRMALRGFAKAIPVVGSAVNSAAAFAFVFATGKVLDWYFAQVAAGHVPSEDEIADAYADQLQAARDYWRRRQLGDHPESPSTGVNA